MADIHTRAALLAGLFAGLIFGTIQYLFPVAQAALSRTPVPFGLSPLISIFVSWTLTGAAAGYALSYTYRETLKDVGPRALFLIVFVFWIAFSFFLPFVSAILNVAMIGDLAALGQQSLTFLISLLFGALSSLAFAWVFVRLYAKLASP